MITLYLFYLIWNTDIHREHPTAIPVLLTIWVLVKLYEIVEE